MQASKRTGFAVAVVVAAAATAVVMMMIVAWFVAGKPAETVVVLETISVAELGIVVNYNKMKDKSGMFLFSRWIVHLLH